MKRGKHADASADDSGEPRGRGLSVPRGDSDQAGAAVMSAPSAYEIRALAQIREWKSPSRSLWKRALTAINKPFDAAGNLVMKVPGVEFVMQKSVGGLVSLLTDGASWSVRTTAIFEEFRGKGHQVQAHNDLYSLDLEAVDSSIGYLAAKYKSISAVEGGGTGLIGLPGIAIDIPALVGMNLRAIGEYATYCGFDVAKQHERLFLMNVLGFASSSTDSAKQVAMAQLVKIAKEVAQKRTWKEIERHAFVAAIKKIAQALGIRLTKAKLAQIIPAAGAIVGAGFNGYYTAKVCDAAYHLYRERFLATKYGPDIIQGDSSPSADEPS